MPIPAILLMALLGLAIRHRRRPVALTIAIGAAVALSACGDPPPTDGGTAEDAGPPIESCDTPGDTRTAPCGFCGTRGQTCSEDMIWEPTSACLMEGECPEGSSETRTLEMCAMQQRVCLAGCAWSDWEDTVGPSECEAGATRLVPDGCGPGELREETCSADCSGWEETAACTNPCGDTPRTSPGWAAEVCVPAGPFMRGSEDYPDTQPVAEVYVSAFYIDAFPVTNERYAQCVDAGTCSQPAALADYMDPLRQGMSVWGIDLLQAQQFCRWDGARRLPTEAEWEKAVRGPAPRTNPYLWEGAEFRCEVLPDGECLGLTGRAMRPNFPWDFPGIDDRRGYYGTYLQYGNWIELVSDRYDPSYYSDPSSLRDPQGPARRDGEVVGRGYKGESPRWNLAYRSHAFPGGNWTFRCARSAE